MTELDTMLVEPFRRMLAEVSAPSHVRAVERSADAGLIWIRIVDSGFLDALLPEDGGGAGLSLSDFFPLVAESGAHCLPVPYAETAFARGLLHAQGASLPDTAIVVLAPSSALVPLAQVATHALVERGAQIALIPVVITQTDPFGVLGGTLDPAQDALCMIDAAEVDLTVAAAGLVAAKMAGSMRRLLDMTLRYARERQQFGRPLGQFQAIQQQLAVMAEQVISANTAARIGMDANQFDHLKVAAAKCRASEASHQVCAIAHAVHGAIGATEEYDLQLHSRRLKQWQMAFGSESCWARRIGLARLGWNQGTSADFVRGRLQGEGTEP